MTSETGSAERGVPIEKRMALLSGVPAFARLPTPALEALAERLREERHPAGGVVVAEGDAGDRLYLISEGRAEVSAAGRAGPVPLARLGPGELFGEIALLEPGGKRQATVSAIAPFLLLSLHVADFHWILSAYPVARDVFVETAEALLVAKFLKQASPFATLDADRLRWLAARLERLTVSAGEDIVRQGQPGEACYLVRSGQVEVLAQGDEGTERRLATLGPGSLFGEAALLTDAPRNATVRALEPCDLLALRREDLLQAIGEDPHAGERMLELLRLRDRPRQAPGVTAHHRTTPTGEAITTLKDPQRGAYYRLSPQGWFIWQRLDGTRTLRDLTIEYLGEFKSFAPQGVADAVGGLAEAGFVDGVKLGAGVRESIDRPTRGQRAMATARRIMEWHTSIRGVDASLTRLYRGGVRLLYAWPGQLLLAVMALAGIVAFVLGIGELGTALEESEAGGWLLLFWIPATLGAILIHEAGHAFTTKHFGREVPRMGVGWYWFGPIAYIDTSDMAGRALAPHRGKPRWAVRGPRNGWPCGAGGLVRPRPHDFSDTLAVRARLLLRGAYQSESSNGVRRVLRPERPLGPAQPTPACPRLDRSGSAPGAAYPRRIARPPPGAALRAGLGSLHWTERLAGGGPLPAHRARLADPDRA